MKKDENNIKAIQITNFKRNKRKLNLKLAKRALRGLLGLAPLKYTADKTDSPLIIDPNTMLSPSISF